MGDDKKKSDHIQLNGQIWPLEKDILFRPDRMKYVRRLIEPVGCVFCSAREKEMSLESLAVYKSKYSMIVLNKFPYNSGHLLVIPQRHCGDLVQFSDDEFLDLQWTLKKAVKALQVIYEPGGINMGVNQGAAAGAGIPDHLHYHVIPRWSGDMNFFPLIAETKVMIESLDQTYEKLSEYFKDGKNL